MKANHARSTPHSSQAQLTSIHTCPSDHPDTTSHTSTAHRILSSGTPLAQKQRIIFRRVAPPPSEVVAAAHGGLGEVLEGGERLGQRHPPLRLPLPRQPLDEPG